MSNTTELAYSDGDVQCIGRVALPAGSERRPGIAIFADLMGIGSQTIERAEIIARDLGYVALAADMYGNGRAITDQAEGMPLMQSFTENPELLASRSGAALAALKAHPRCNGQLGAIGFCFGGGVVLGLARSGTSELMGGVSFHGTLSTVRQATAGSIKAKLLVCHGAEDPFVPMDDLVTFLKEMATAQADCQTIAYTGAGHSFTNPATDALNIPGVKFHEPTDRRSWQAMTAFFQEIFSGR